MLRCRRSASTSTSARTPRSAHCRRPTSPTSTAVTAPVLRPVDAAQPVRTVLQGADPGRVAWRGKQPLRRSGNVGRCGTRLEQLHQLPRLHRSVRHLDDGAGCRDLRLLGYVHHQLLARRQRLLRRFWEPDPAAHGATGVAVYTDEHGEAYVQYNPYPGIVLTPDSNGRCDIYGPAPVGHSTITATSVYPDQPVLWDGGNKTSNALAKTVNYASSKVLNCVAKSRNEAFCVETILDPQGNPVPGARSSSVRRHSRARLRSSDPTPRRCLRMTPPPRPTGAR